MQCKTMECDECVFVERDCNLLSREENIFDLHKLFVLDTNTAFIVSSCSRRICGTFMQKQQLTSDEAFISLEIYCSPWH